MNLTGTEVRVGMTAAANVSSVNTTGSVTIGTPVAALVYTDAPTVAYSLRMDIADGETLTLDMITGAVTGSDPGVLQVETATVIAAAGATTAGDATVIVIAANLAESPLTLPVALSLADNTASLIATKIRAALNASGEISAIFTVGGTGANVTLTAKIAIANDTTLNISIANGTCDGITAAPTSTSTTAGVLATQAYRISGAVWDETDFEGHPLPSLMSEASCIFINAFSGILLITSGTNEITLYESGKMLLFSSAGGTAFSGTSVSFNANSGNVAATIDIHALT